ncbi:MAG: FMN-binding protein [Spirochaetae bacterium HGW-Spirochaetae-9]|nr:MAG: FMN-binding protein [Spirochaetae bacterium HGW-Spirochaetae-9]
MKLKKESIGYVVVFTFVACAAFMVLLAVANQATLGQVEANRRYASHYAVLKAFGLADLTTSKGDVESGYASLVKELPEPAPGMAAYSTIIEGAPFVAVKITNAGLWGPITAILAADPQAERIRGFELLDQQETPGLGGRIGEPWFSAQFTGEKVAADGKIAVSQGSGKGDPDKENSRVDAVTGASRTSDFVQRLVINALAAVKQIGGSL